MRRTPSKPGKPLRRRTELRSSSILKRTGTTKSRKASASTLIPKSIKDGIDDRDAGLCQRCGQVIGSGPFSRHHRDPRGMGGSKLRHTLANVVLLCGSATTPGGCHHEVESYREQAELDGWLVPMGIRPEVYPVKRFGLDYYQQPGAEWVDAPPHPLQTKSAA